MAKNREENIQKTRAIHQSHQQAKFELREKNRMERKKRSPKEQLAVLDFRLGKNVGAKKERERLLSKVV